MLNRSGVQNSYSHNVRIGNWAEDKQLQELRMKEYLHRKEKGGLLIHSVQRNLQSSLQEVPLTHSQDGFVHIGDTVMCYNANTEGVLSVDISDRTPSSDEGYAVTTSTLTQAHVARNVFTIEPYGGGVARGDALKLGQPFRLKVHSTLKPTPFYLHSQPKSMTSSSKITRRQEVCIMGTAGYDSAWVVQFKDVDKRFEMEGQPVPANAEVVIQHCATGQALSSGKDTYHNDFGAEFEVCAHTAQTVGKKQALYAEAQGTTTGDIAARSEKKTNWWAFLTAADPSSSALPQQQPPSQPQYLDENKEVAF